MSNIASIIIGTCRRILYFGEVLHEMGNFPQNAVQRQNHDSVCYNYTSGVIKVVDKR